YSLSCEIEPLSESASNTLKAKKNTGIIKRWSDRQPVSSSEASCSSTGSSHSKSFDQLRYPSCLTSGAGGAGGGAEREDRREDRRGERGGERGDDSISVTSAGSSSSDVEEINISFISDSPDTHEKKTSTPCVKHSHSSLGKCGPIGDLTPT
ncbi:ral guanine nucleotide dissociation stimulator isoform X1, partial [Tachysurus ichikawai]